MIHNLWAHWGLCLWSTILNTPADILITPMPDTKSYWSPQSWEGNESIIWGVFRSVLLFIYLLQRLVHSPMSQSKYKFLSDMKFSWFRRKSWWKERETFVCWAAVRGDNIYVEPQRRSLQRFDGCPLLHLPSNALLKSTTINTTTCFLCFLLFILQSLSNLTWSPTELPLRFCS